MSKFKYKPGMKKHQVLKEAMKYLDVKNCKHPEDKYEFVCHCINRVINKDELNFNDHPGLIAVIEERLFPHDTLNTWLLNKHKVYFKERMANQGRKLQYTRKMWMQSMYEEFLAKDE